MVLGFCAVIFMGCAERSGRIPEGPVNIRENSSIPQEIKDLAGQWKYVDNAGGNTIFLNAQGHGDYQWEEGRFETLSLENGTWIGVWSQKGNDREGGFRLRFSDCSSVAQGDWWYTRIGNDQDPPQPGGIFTMSRLPTFKIAE